MRATARPPTLVLAIVLASCGDGAPPNTPVDTDGWVGTETSVAAAGPPAAREPVARLLASEARREWPYAAELDLLVTVANHTPSEHFDGRAAIEVRVSPPFVEGYRALSTSPVIPADTVVAAYHRPLGADSISGGIFVMRRTGPRWAYAILDEAFRSAGTEAAENACARCHAEAPHASLFGVRTDAER